MILVKTEEEGFWRLSWNTLRVKGSHAGNCSKCVQLGAKLSSVRGGRGDQCMAFVESKNILLAVPWQWGRCYKNRNFFKKPFQVSCGFGGIYLLHLPSKELQLKLVDLVCISGSFASCVHPVPRSYVFKMLFILFPLAVALWGLCDGIPRTQQRWGYCCAWGVTEEVGIFISSFLLGLWR